MNASKSPPHKEFCTISGELDIRAEIENLEDIEKSEIYLPFAAQKLLSKNMINIDVVDSDSDWFGVTYKEDKQMAVDTINSHISNGIYPSNLWS